MHVDLRRTSQSYVRIQTFLDALARGAIDLRNPTDDQCALISPTNITPASSDQLQLQAIVGTDLAQLPGGPLRLAVGGSIRFEAVDAPSANSDINGHTQRYFSLNAFGTEGNRYIYSGFFELAAPILEQVEVNLSGRYDRYSTPLPRAVRASSVVILGPVPKRTFDRLDQLTFGPLENGPFIFSTDDGGPLQNGHSGPRSLPRCCLTVANGHRPLP